MMKERTVVSMMNERTAVSMMKERSVVRDRRRNVVRGASLPECGGSLIYAPVALGESESLVTICIYMW
jgi:hypothetical protein